MRTAIGSYDACVKREVIRLAPTECTHDAGLQCLELKRDGTCAIDPSEPVGFLWVSLKAYLPSRAQCLSAKKGPPILSPFTKYNKIPIPTPEQLKCTARFGLRLHIFQVI